MAPHTRFPTVPYALQPTIPHLTRSSLHRCLQRHGIGRLVGIEGDKPAKKRFKSYPIGFFHIDIAEVQTAGDCRESCVWGHSEAAGGGLWRSRRARWTSF